METVTPPAALAPGVELARKYRLGALLATDTRQSDYETIFRGVPATIRIFRTPAAGQSTLAAGFQLAFQLPHPHLLAVYDFGEDAIAGEQVAWIVMEHGDECLADILSARKLQEDEALALIEGILPALEFLHKRGLGHSEIGAANIFACGSQIKLTPDRITSTAAGTGALQISRLILDALVGSRDESAVEKLNSPFREIVRGGSSQDLARIKAALSGELSSEPASRLPFQTAAERPSDPKYRRYAGLAIGGVLTAAALCALLIRSAQPPPPGAPVPEKVPLIAPSPPEPHAATGEGARVSSTQPLAPKGWDIVSGPFARYADARKRVAQIGKTHSGLAARVYAADKSGKHFVIVFASATTDAQAKKELIRLRRGGVPRGTHIAHFE